MTTQMQKAIRELKTDCKDPVFIRTRVNAVAVFGWEHVSKKEMTILAHCLNLPVFEIGNPHGIKSVVFRIDNRPAGRFAECEPNSGSITINLLHTFVSAMERVTNEEEGVSIQAAYHRNMILNMLHEIHHINYLRSGIPATDEQMEEAEKMASEWAIDEMLNLSDRVNLEPGPYYENPFLSLQIAEMLKSKTEFCAVQQHMLDNCIMMEFEETETTRETTFNFREYISVLYTQEEFTHKAVIDMGERDPILDNILSINATTSSRIGSPTEAVKEAERVLTKEERLMASGFMPATNGYPEERPVVGGIEELEAMEAMCSLDEIEEPSNVDAWCDDIKPARPNPPPAPRPAAPSMSMQQATDIVMGVYKKIYNHIFTECRPLMQGDMAFDYPEAVCKPITLTDVERSVIVSSNALDEYGRWTAKKNVADGLRGDITKDQKLPRYTLYIEVGGNTIVRTLIPQSVNSRHSNGQLKNTALAARNGSSIIWVMEGDEVKARSKKYLLKMQDGQITQC